MLKTPKFIRHENVPPYTNKLQNKKRYAFVLEKYQNKIACDFV